MLGLAAPTLGAETGAPPGPSPCGRRRWRGAPRSPPPSSWCRPCCSPAGRWRERDPEAGTAAPPAAGLGRAGRAQAGGAQPDQGLRRGDSRPSSGVELHADARHRRPAGTERRRQDHPAARAHRPARAHPRQGALPRRRRSRPDNLADYRRRIGFLPQEFNAYPGFTAEQFLDHWALERGLTDPRQRRSRDRAPARRRRPRPSTPAARCATSPAACASGWASPAPCSARRRS